MNNSLRLLLFSKMMATGGFSLIELMVALVIAIILIMVGVPTFNSLIRDYRLRITSEDLYNTLNYARTEAVKRNAIIYVSFNTGDTWCYGVNTGSACNCTVANNCNLGTTTYPAAQQLTMTTSGLVSNSIYFEGAHGAANASGSMTFTEYGLTPYVQLTVGRLGRVQSCSNTLGGYQGC